MQYNKLSSIRHTKLLTSHWLSGEPSSMLPTVYITPQRE